MFLQGCLTLSLVTLLLQCQGISSRRFLGCYKDSGQRLLPGFWDLGEKMTIESCATKCANEGYRFAGTQYYTQCFCGNNYPPHDRVVSETNCNTPCRANKTEMCGGVWHSHVYDLLVTEATQNLLPFVGCYLSLPNSKQISEHIKAPECVLGCRHENYKYAGFVGSKCVCSNVAPASIAAKPTTPQDCDCKLAVYFAREGNLKKYMGCYKMESEAFNSQEMAITRDITCPELCRRKGLRYSARDSDFECYCSDERPSYKLMAPDENCMNDCKHSAFESCPAPGYIRVNDLAVGHAYDPQLDSKGCYVEDADGGAVMEGVQLILSDNTPEKCVGLCYYYGYKFAGVKNGNLCLCGKDVAAAEPGSCTKACPGDRRQTCGGKEAVAIYKTKTLKPEPTDLESIGLARHIPISKVNVIGEPWK